MNTSIKSSRGRSTAVRTQIDENLKRVYEDALNEEVPDRFMALLEQLKRGETFEAPNSVPESPAASATASASETAE